MKKNIVPFPDDPDSQSIANALKQRIGELYRWAEACAGFERKEVEATNRSKIAAFEIREKFLRGRHETLTRRITELPVEPAGGASGYASLLTSVVLGLVGLASAIVTFEPFGG